MRRPLGALKLASNVDGPPTWCGAMWTMFVRGTWRPPSLVEPGAKVVVIVFTKEAWWPSSNTLSECYNNMDVGVPLWLTEPRDKHPRQEFASLYPAL